MKIFTQENGFFDNKINFVDENNVFVGFDMTQDCCENFDWFIGNHFSKNCGYDFNEENSEGNVEKLNNELIDYYFDVDFFDDQTTDEGGAVVFRLTNGNEEKYLYLLCEHNGYYAHGFEFLNNGELIQGGYI